MLNIQRTISRENFSSDVSDEIFRWMIKISPDEHFWQRYFQWSSSISVIISVIHLFQTYPVQVTGDATWKNGSCFNGNTSSIYASWKNCKIGMEFKFLNDSSWFLYKIQAEVFKNKDHRGNTFWILKIPIFFLLGFVIKRQQWPSG